MLLPSRRCAAAWRALPPLRRWPVHPLGCASTGPSLRCSLLSLPAPPETRLTARPLDLVVVLFPLYFQEWSYDAVLPTARRVLAPRGPFQRPSASLRGFSEFPAFLSTFRKVRGVCRGPAELGQCLTSPSAARLAPCRSASRSRMETGAFDAKARRRTAAAVAIRLSQPAAADSPGPVHRATTPRWASCSTRRRART